MFSFQKIRSVFPQNFAGNCFKILPEKELLHITRNDAIAVAYSPVPGTCCFFWLKSTPQVNSKNGRELKPCRCSARGVPGRIQNMQKMQDGLPESESLGGAKAQGLSKLNVEITSK